MARTQEWWENFWANLDQDYGDANNTLLEYAGQFIEGKENLTAVDIASGNGRYAIPLAKMGYKVSAIEYSEKGVERIKKYAEKEGVDVDAKQGDFTKQCFEDRQYDLVLSSGLLEEIDKEHHENVVKGYMNWTKPGGMNIIKYCLEIGGRGQLVNDDYIYRFYTDAGWKILFIQEKQSIYKSRANINFNDNVDASIRTGTVVAVKP